MLLSKSNASKISQFSSDPLIALYKMVTTTGPINYRAPRSHDARTQSTAERKEPLAQPWDAISV